MQVEYKTISISHNNYYIRLNNLADPSTVKVSVLGKEIIPLQFDVYGQPYFSKKQAEKEFYYTKYNEKEYRYERLQRTIEISYEERDFNIPKESFDTIEGIKNSLSGDNLDDFYQLIVNRKMFVTAHKQSLNEFILFGHIILDYNGNLYISNRVYSPLIRDDIEALDVFCIDNGLQEIYLNTSLRIPDLDSVFSIYGKNFSISDLRNNYILNPRNNMV